MCLHAISLAVKQFWMLEGKVMEPDNTVIKYDRDMHVSYIHLSRIKHVPCTVCQWPCVIHSVSVTMWHAQCVSDHASCTVCQWPYVMHSVSVTVCHAQCVSDRVSCTVCHSPVHSFNIILQLCPPPPYASFVLKQSCKSEHVYTSCSAVILV